MTDAGNQPPAQQGQIAPEEAELVPISGQAWSASTRRLVAIALVIGVVALGFFLLFGVLDSIIVAALLAFLIEPILRGLVNKLHFPRWLAVTVVYLATAAIAIGAVFILPALIIGSLAQIDFHEIVASFETWLTNVATSLSSTNFLGVDLTAVSAVSDASSQASTSADLLDPGRWLGALTQALVAAAGAAGLLIGIISGIVFVLIIAIYMTADSSRYFRSIANLVPKEYELEVFELGRRLNASWNDYIRGQGIMILVIGFTTFVVVWLIGLPGALFLAVIAGLLEVIPTFGPIIATIPAVIIALVQGSTRFVDMNNIVFALLVIIAYTLIQQLESNIVAPKVMGHSVQLPALVVLISVTAGYQVAGILGAILAVPVVANVRVLLSYLWAKIHSREPWAEPT
ncbi:MAG TPA: AI-2E family transporter [Acidimicrobiia bacterium]